MGPTFTLAATLLLYGLGSVVVLFSLVARSIRAQRIAVVLMGLGFVPHTIWIGIVCVRTNHPPLTNLPEAAAFIAWTILAVEIFLFVRHRIQAATFFVYPLVLLLTTIPAIVTEQYVEIDESMRSALFVSHTLLAALGVAGLLLALVFTMLYHVQERALRSKRRGPLYDWIPSLQLCDTMSYRSLATGFAIYTLGLLAGVLWSYRSTAGMSGVRAKEIAAVVAWVLFAALLQSYLSGTFRTRKTLVVSAAAFVAIIIAVLGIQRG